MNTSFKSNYNWWKTQILKHSIIIASNINFGNENNTQKKTIRPEKEGQEHKNTGKISCKNAEFSLTPSTLKKKDYPSY